MPWEHLVQKLGQGAGKEEVGGTMIWFTVWLELSTGDALETFQARVRLRQEWIWSQGRVDVFTSEESIYVGLQDE